MKNKERISIIILLIGIVVGPGSLIITMLTHNALWFIIGLPCAAGMLLLERIWDKRGRI